MARERQSATSAAGSARVAGEGSSVAPSSLTAEPRQRVGWSWLDIGFRRAARECADVPEGPSPATTLRREATYRRMLALADMSSAILAVVVGTALLGDDRLKLATIVAVPFVVAVSKVSGLYDRDPYLLNKTTLDEVPRLFYAATLYALSLWLAEPLIVEGMLGRTQIMALWALLFVSMTAARFVARAGARSVTVPERLLVVGDRQVGEWLAEKLDSNSTTHAHLIGRVPWSKDEGRGDSPDEQDSDYPEPKHEHLVLGPLVALGVLLAEHRIDRVVVASSTSDSEAMHGVIRLVRSLGVHLTVLPSLFDVIGSSIEFDALHGTTLLGLRRGGLSRSSRFLKRAGDLAGASLAGLVLAPLWLPAALAIRVSSLGSVLFRQPRIGRDGKTFMMFKFRTMVEDADLQKADLRHLNEANGLFKITDDPRVTSVGRFLRRSSLDEIPQVLNVLRGDMSLVGPRPLVPEDDLLVEGWERRRLQVRPGMTGLWQIFGSSRVPIDEMVKIDYLYSANWTLWLDVKVLLRTVPYVLTRRGL